MSGAQSESARGDIERCRSARARDRIPGADSPREQALEIFDKWPGGQELAAERFAYRGDIVLIDQLPSIRQKRSF